MSEENYLFQTEGYMGNVTQAVADVQMDKFLIFMSDSLMFGVDAGNVVEIITSHMITNLPMVPDYVQGIINLRGLIIPIVNIRRRLGKPLCDNDCIIVITVDGVQIGILVDGVDQMVDVAHSDISPVPAQNSQEMVSGMCSLADGQTMLVLDCSQLLHT